MAGRVHLDCSGQFGGYPVSTDHRTMGEKTANCALIQYFLMLIKMGTLNISLFGDFEQTEFHSYTGDYRPSKVATISNVTFVFSFGDLLWMCIMSFIINVYVLLLYFSRWTDSIIIMLQFSPYIIVTSRGVLRFCLYMTLPLLYKKAKTSLQ